ncbi:MAG: HAD family hydrolase [Bacteroidota bacterium]
MKDLEKYKIVLWDFDGVIMDSMPIRDKGFVDTLSVDYPKEQVDNLLEFHRANGGLSRYVKFRYFFEKIRNEEVTEEEILELAQKFSEVMLSLLIDEKLLIEDSVSFIKSNYAKYKFHIVSGSDGKELNKICQGVGLDKFFITIEGSPTPKKQLVENILQQYGYDKNDCVLIGDSHNDHEAAQFNGISFFGYNNSALRELGYIDNFTNTTIV